MTHYRESDNHLRDAKQAGAVSPRLLAAAFAFATLWDFYLPGLRIRPFDFLSFALLATWIVFGLKHPASAGVMFAVGLGAFGMVLDFGTSTRNGRSGIAEVIVVALFAALRVSSGDGKEVVRVVRPLLWTHAAALVLQFSIYHMAGRFVEYHTLFGLESRNFSSIFRPSGLFLEPSSYSTNALALYALLVRYQDDRPSDFFVTAVSTVLSFSAFGFGLLGMYTSYVLVRFPELKSRILGAMSAFLIVIIFAFSVDGAREAFEQTSARFDFQDDSELDSSAQGRYGALIGLASGNVDVEPRDVLGAGFGGDYLRYGSSGFAELFSIFGFPIGGALFLAFLRSVPGRTVPSRWFLRGAVFALMANAPLFKYAFLPLWARLLVASDDEQR